MAGVSDLAYRLINRHLGCKLAFTEMISCRALVNQTKKTLTMLKTNTLDQPLAVQIIGADLEYIKRAIEILNQTNYAFIDFNAACPVRKVVNRNEGAAFLKDLVRLETVLSLIVKTSRFPVTVKIRSGWDEKNINAVDTAKAAQNAGVSAIFIHGRSRQQFYAGTVNYEIIAQVKKQVKVPIIASGDILTPQLAEKMYKLTNCDGLLVARGSFGNPWIFKQIKHYLKTKEIKPQPKLNEITQMMRQHLNLLHQEIPDKAALIFHKLFIWYTKGIANSRPFRAKVSRIKHYKQMHELIDIFENDQRELKNQE